MRNAGWAVAPLVMVAMAGCSSAPPKEEVKAPETAAVKIDQFYAAEPKIGKGEAATLCYGVTDAQSVTLAPAVEKVWPALSRCFDVRPAETTKYTLTAAGADGRTVSESVTVEVGPARARPAASAGGSAGGSARGRYIVEVTVSKLSIAAGEPVVVCYQARNATSVKISPGVAGQQQSPERGCITDRPKATTTYTVVATGAGGETDSERVTVKVR